METDHKLAVFIVLVGCWCLSQGCRSIQTPEECNDTQVYDRFFSRICLDCDPCPADYEEMEKCTLTYRTCCKKGNRKDQNNRNCIQVHGRRNSLVTSSPEASDTSDTVGGRYKTDDNSDRQKKDRILENHVKSQVGEEKSDSKDLLNESVGRDHRVSSCKQQVQIEMGEELSFFLHAVFSIICFSCVVSSVTLVMIMKMMMKGNNSSQRV